MQEKNMGHICPIGRSCVNQLNSENCFALLTDKVSTNSFYSFKVFIKNRILNSCQKPIIITGSFILN